MTPPTFEIVALYSGVSRTMSSALSARASSSAAASDVDCGGFTGGTEAGVGVVGGAGGVAEDCSIGLGSGALRGAYSAVKAYITAIDKTKARMTRFSIQDQSDFLFRIGPTGQAAVGTTSLIGFRPVPPSLSHRI